MFSFRFHFELVKSITMIPIQQEMQAGALPTADSGDPGSILASRMLASRAPISASNAICPISPPVPIGPISPTMAPIGQPGRAHQWHPGTQYTGSPATSNPTLSADASLPAFFPSTFEPPNQNSPHHHQQQSLQQHQHQHLANHAGGGGSGLSLNKTLVSEQGDPGSVGSGSGSNSGAGPSGLMQGGEGAFGAPPMADGLSMASSSHSILRGVLPGSLDELCPVCNDKVSGYHYGACLGLIYLYILSSAFALGCPTVRQRSHLTKRTTLNSLTSRQYSSLAINSCWKILLTTV